MSIWPFRAASKIRPASAMASGGNSAAVCGGFGEVAFSSDVVGNGGAESITQVFAKSKKGNMKEVVWTTPS